MTLRPACFSLISSNSFVLYLFEPMRINLTFFKLNTSLLCSLLDEESYQQHQQAVMWSSFIIFDCHNDPLELLTRNQYDNQHFTCEIQILNCS